MAAEEPIFAYQFRTRENYIIVDVKGTLDISTIKAAQNMVDVFMSQGSNILLMNLKNMEYVDSSGLGFFTGTLKKLVDKGGELILFSFHPYVARIFSLIQLDYFITTFEDEDEAIDYLQKGRKNAIAKWKKAISLNDDYADAHFHLATVYGDEGIFDKAKDELERAIAINPAYGEAYKSLGDIHYKLGNSQQAVGFFEKALEFKPNDPEIIVNLGQLYQDKARLIKSIELFESALLKNPYYADLRNGLGVAYLLTNELDLAREHLRLALEINPQYTDARLNYLRVLKERGDTEQFLQQVEIVKKQLVRPDQKEIFQQITKIYDRNTFF